MIKKRWISIIITYIVLVSMLVAYFLTFVGFGVSNFGNKVVFVANENHPYENHSLIIADINKKNIEVSDYILFFNSYNASNEILHAKVLEVIEVSKNETTYFLDNNKYLSSSYVIANSDDVREITKIGNCIRILTSGPVYFTFLVLPLFVFWLYIVKKTKISFKKEVKSDD